MALAGYIHLFLQSVTLKQCTNPVKVCLSIGQQSKDQSQEKIPNDQFNQVFMFQVPKNPQRLAIKIFDKQSLVGQCRYDIKPFFQHRAMSHIVQSKLYNQENKEAGSVKLKLIFYTQQFGKLKIRIFFFQVIESFAQKFKEAKIKVTIGYHAQSTPLKALNGQWDQTVQMIVLDDKLNLTFEIIHEDGILGLYRIQNIRKSNLLIDQTKAYQVSLFNHDKAIGNIKYQIDWIKPKQ